MNITNLGNTRSQHEVRFFREISPEVFSRVTNFVDHQFKSFLRVTHFSENPNHFRPQILSRADCERVIQVGDCEGLRLFQKLRQIIQIVSKKHEV